MLAAVKKSFQERFHLWVDRRIPESVQVTLNQRKIFIFPSGAGFAFLCVVASLLVGGINYENNMLFAAAFLMLSIFVVTILHTYSNLSGLTLKCGSAQPTFVDDFAEFEVILSREGSRNYEGIQLKWPGSDMVSTSLINGRQQRVALFLPARQRGVLHAGRLLVETYYPTGLFRAWTWLDFNARCLVYPRPIEHNNLQMMASESQQEGRYSREHGNEDFAGFKNYVAGDSLKQVAWKQVARGLPPLSKQFQSQADQRMWIDWDAFGDIDVELRLSHMCYLILVADQRGLEYGVRLPGFEAPPANTGMHRLQALQALALYGARPAD